MKSKLAQPSSTWLDTRAACDRLDVSRGTLYKLVDEGLPAFYLSARNLRFRSADLDIWLESRPARVN